MFLSNAAVILLLVYFFNTIVLETYTVCWLRNQSRVFVVCKSLFFAVCHDMFISTSEVLILVVPFLDYIGLENPSVRWIRNKLIVLFRYLIIWRIYGL